MADRFPDYDVLAKRNSQSWNAKTREVIDERQALQLPEDVLTPTQLATLRAVVRRLCPDPAGRARDRVDAAMQIGQSVRIPVHVFSLSG